MKIFPHAEIIFKKKLFFNFFAKFLLLRKIKFWKIISPRWGEPLSDKRRSRWQEPLSL